MSIGNFPEVLSQLILVLVGIINLSIGRLGAASKPLSAVWEGVGSTTKRPDLGIHHRGVQSEGGAVDGGSII